MKSPDRKTVTELTELPNIGPAIAEDLHLLGILHPRDLIDENPYQLFKNLCRKTGVRHDPCVLDVFLAAVDYMEGGEAVPWWKFTAQRKKNLSQMEE